MARSEAYDRYPEHVLEFETSAARIRVWIGSDMLAETDRGLSLKEANYPVVVYIPREDVRMELLEASAHPKTHCPFKGDANYFDYRNAKSRPEGEQVQPVAWSYTDPFDQMLDIKGLIAFYSDRVTIDS